MWSRSLLAALLLCAIGCARAPAPAAPPPPDEVSLEVFVDALAVHGEWIAVSPHGRVWRPFHVPAGWRPYLYGEWVWTAEGWFWLTDEPWGWATYHYGRWAHHPTLGWIWVPGYVWGPAWVAWRVVDGFVGWAPLYPGITVWWVETYPLEPAHWVFVPTTSFVAVRVEHVAVPPARVPALVRASRPAPPPSGVRPAVAAPPSGGPTREHVETHGGRPVRPDRIVAVPAPAETRRRPAPGAVPVYRPAPAPKKSRPAPAKRPEAPAPRR